MSKAPVPTTPDQPTAVLYNAQCPVCNFEISHYERKALREGLPIKFDDLNTVAREAWNIDADAAARRLYVLHEGELFSGMDGFRVLWRQMPNYTWLARLTALPVLRPIGNFLYDKVVAPLIYKYHIRRQARRAQDVNRSR